MPVRVRRPAVGLGLGLVVAAAWFLPSAAVSKPSGSPNLIKNGGSSCRSSGSAATGSSLSARASPAGRLSGQRETWPRSVARSGKTGSASPPRRKQWLDLTGGTSNQQVGVAQSVKTRPGASYRLSFAVGNVVDPAGVFGTSSTVNVLVNGYKVLAATNKRGARSRPGRHSR